MKMRILIPFLVTLAVAYISPMPSGAAVKRSHAGQITTSKGLIRPKQSYYFRERILSAGGVIPVSVQPQNTQRPPVAYTTVSPNYPIDIYVTRSPTFAFSQQRAGVADTDKGGDLVVETWVIDRPSGDSTLKLKRSGHNHDHQPLHFKAKEFAKNVSIANVTQDDIGRSLLIIAYGVFDNGKKVITIADPIIVPIEKDPIPKQ